jgi:hypothetical protein
MVSTGRHQKAIRPIRGSTTLVRAVHPSDQLTAKHGCLVIAAGPINVEGCVSSGAQIMWESQQASRISGGKTDSGRQVSTGEFLQLAHSLIES